MATFDTEKERKEDFKIFTIVVASLYVVAAYLILQYYAYANYLGGDRGMKEVMACMSKNLPKYFYMLPAVPKGCVPILMLLAMIAGLVIMYKWSAGKANASAKKGTENGTADWFKDIRVWNRKYRDSTEQHNMIFTKDVYMDMNTRRTKRNNNVFVIGGSGSGKSRYFVKPNICELPLNTSFVVTDPAGEMLGEIGHLLEGAGYEIKVFNLVNMKESGRYNPLRYVHTETDIIQLTDCLLANTTDPNSKGDDFWEKAQKMMFQAYLYLIWKHGEDFSLKQNLNTLISLMLNTSVSEEETSNQDKGETDKYFVALESKGWWKNPTTGEVRFDPPAISEQNVFKRYEPVGSNDIAVKEYKKFRTGAGKTLKSILISAEARLSAMSPQAVVDLVDDDDINLETLGDKKSALFIIIPQGNKSFNFLAAILYTQLFQFLYYHAQYECQGNYLVKDGRGEVVKMFDVSHDVDDDALAAGNCDDDEEIEVDISYNKEDDKPKKGLFGGGKKQKDLEGVNATETVSFDKINSSSNPIQEDMPNNNVEDHPETVPNNDSGKEDKVVRILAEDFAANASQNVKKIQRGNKFIVRICLPDGKNEDIDTYTIEKFADERIRNIQKGCYVERCGLYLPFHVRFLLDEFANIGKIPEFEEKLATMRKYEISASIITQNLSQLKKMYDKDWGTVIGNCDSFLFLGCPEYDTNDYVSKLLGDGTITSKDRSESHGSKGSTSNSYKATKRALLTPDEIRRLDNDTCIYMQRGEYAFLSKKHPYTTHPNFKYTADKDKSLTYYYRKPVTRSSIKKAAEAARGTMTAQQLTESALKISNLMTKSREMAARNAGGREEEVDGLSLLSMIIAREADEKLSTEDFGDFFDQSQELARQAAAESGETHKDNVRNANDYISMTPSKAALVNEKVENSTNSNVSDENSSDESEFLNGNALTESSSSGSSIFF